MLAYILCIALTWLPFANSLLTLKFIGVTWTIYVALIVLVFPFCFMSYLGGKHSKMSLLQDACIVLFTIQLGILLLNTQNTVGAAYKYVYGILIPASLYFAVKGAVRKEKQYLNIIKATSVGIFIFSLAYIPSFVINGLSSRVVVFGRDSIAAAIFFSFTLLFLTLTPIMGKLKIFAFGASAMSLLATLSRGLMLCGFLTPAFAWIARRRLLNRVFFFTMLSTLALTLLLIFNSELVKPDHWDPQLENSLERITNIDYWKNGIYGRLRTFQPSVEEFYKSPFYGSGLPDIVGGSTVHNFHMEWLQYGGIIGYILICSSFLIHFARMGRYIQDHYIAAGCIFIFYMIINGLMNGMMHGIAPDMTFLVLALNDARYNFIRRQSLLRRTL